MRITRWAALPTLLMALLNVPAGPGSDPKDIPTAVAWTATVVGLAGLVAAIALLRRVDWARPAVIAIGAVNAVGGVAALLFGWGGGAVGIVLGLAAVALAVPEPRDERVASR